LSILWAWPFEIREKRNRVTVKKLSVREYLESELGLTGKEEDYIMSTYINHCFFKIFGQR
jgi:hypothetical protein